MVLVIEGFLLTVLDELATVVNKRGFFLLIDLRVALLACVRFVLGLLILIVNDLILLDLVLVCDLHLASCGNFVAKIRLSRPALTPRTHALRAPLRVVLIQMLLTVIVVVGRFLETPLSGLEIVQRRVSVVIKPMIMHQLALLSYCCFVY